MTFSRWIRATFGGWVAGVPLVALFALVGETIHLGGAHVLVGAGMGTGVGLVQGRALRGVLDRALPWVWSCAIGLAVPFLCADVLRWSGHDSRYAQQIALAVGGVVVGAWQAFLLRAHVSHAAWWIVASAVGWSLAALAVVASDLLLRQHAVPGLAGAAAYLGLIAAGGLLLGISTGVALVSLLRPSPQSM